MEHAEDSVGRSEACLYQAIGGQAACRCSSDLSTFQPLDYQIGENMLRFLGRETCLAIRRINYVDTDACCILHQELKHPEKGQELMESFRKDFLSLEHVYIRNCY